MFFIALIITNTVHAQKKKGAIINSDSIEEIESYLQTAHQDDPRRSILKKRLVSLKNSEWTKGAKVAKPMAVRLIENNVTNITASTEEEFRKLMAENTTELQHKKNTVNLLNTMFDDNPSTTEAIMLFRNITPCNMVLEIVGSDRQYKIPVPSNNEIPVVLPKGKYELHGNLCNSPYNSIKELQKSTLIVLSKKTENPKETAEKLNTSFSTDSKRKLK